MDYSKPTLLVVSGPNGAGKSTYILTMMPVEFQGVVPFNRDVIRTSFLENLWNSDYPKQKVEKRAFQLMEEKLREAIETAIRQKQHFVLETPLSHPDYWKHIDQFEINGYQIQLNYLGLDKISDCKIRVAKRVSEGGHNVDAKTIKGVFETNLKFINDFKNTFQLIELYDGMRYPSLLVRIEHQAITFQNETALKKEWIKKGLPSIFRQLKKAF